MHRKIDIDCLSNVRFKVCSIFPGEPNWRISNVNRFFNRIFDMFSTFTNRNPFKKCQTRTSPKFFEWFVFFTSKKTYFFLFRERVLCSSYGWTTRREVHTPQALRIMQDNSRFFRLHKTTVGENFVWKTAIALTELN